MEIPSQVQSPSLRFFHMARPSGDLRIYRLTHDCAILQKLNSIAVLGDGRQGTRRDIHIYIYNIHMDYKDSLYIYIYHFISGFNMDMDAHGFSLPGIINHSSHVTVNHGKAQLQHPRDVHRFTAGEVLESGYKDVPGHSSFWESGLWLTRRDVFCGGT